MLVDLTVREFLEQLAGNSAVPGGGSAAALAGAMGAGLAAMVAELTIGKPKFAEVEAQMREMGENAANLKLKLLGLVDADSDAYAQVMTAFRLPKSTDEEIATRKLAIQDATISAARTPLETMRLSVSALPFLKLAAAKGNPNCASDCGVGALMIAAAAEGAYRNVMINLDGIKDSDVREPIREEAKSLLAKCREEATVIRSQLYSE